jgi:hypothetical protein
LVVLMLVWQQPDLLVEVVRLCEGLLHRGFLVQCRSFPWWPALVKLTTVPTTDAASS